MKKHPSKNTPTVSLCVQIIADSTIISETSGNVKSVWRFGDSSVGWRRRGKGWGNGQEEVLLDSYSLLSEERQAVLILETLGIAKGARVQLMGRTAMPCTFDDLVNAGIGTTQLTAPRLEAEDIRAISIP